MPPTHPLSTPCRYGYNCTRRDCYYTHPKGMKKDQQQLCSFGRSCFRKVCYLDHPSGRMMDQLRPGFDYCSACTLVRPVDLGWVSAAFQQVFPAPEDGKERCEFVAAVPMGVAFRDWKRYRGVSSTGTPDGVPSTPEKIRLFPRTKKGERLLQDPANRLGMRWSPTPYRPWKTLERMVTHDQFWEENQEMFVMCAGYEAANGEGVCIELSATGSVKLEDGGEGSRAGARVADEVLGLPNAGEQKWFVFHVSRPDDSDEEAQFVTVKTIVDTSKLPAISRHHPIKPLPAPGTSSSSSPRGAAPFLPRLPPGIPLAGLGAAVVPRPPETTPPPSISSVTRPPPGIPTATRPPPGTQPVGTISSAGVARSAAGSHQDLGPVSYASSSAPASTDSEFGSSTLSFGSFLELDETASLSGAVLAPPPPPPPHVGAALPTGPNGITSLAALEPPPVVDELSNLLASLNMTKHRPKFDSKKVDYKTLMMMTDEEQLSVIEIPLGPRIKLMKELGIERPAG